MCLNIGGDKNNLLKPNRALQSFFFYYTAQSFYSFYCMVAPPLNFFGFLFKKIDEQVLSTSTSSTACK